MKVPAANEVLRSLSSIVFFAPRSTQPVPSPFSADGPKKHMYGVPGVTNGYVVRELAGKGSHTRGVHEA